MKLMLREMEKDLGLEQMSRAEKAILSALCGLQAGTENFHFYCLLARGFGGFFHLQIGNLAVDK